jgi:hypothetical protein
MSKEVTKVVNPRAGIDQAMFNIKSELTAVKKTASNPFFNSKYADLNTILAAVEPLLYKNGCSLRQPVQCHQGQNIVLSAIVHTETGQEASSSFGIPSDIKDPQKLGSAITYFRRYTLGSLLAMQAEDDDGNVAVGKKASKITANKGGF